MDVAGPNTILNWRGIDERLSTSGQPDEKQIAAIAAQGVAHVINLGLHSHPKALPDERASVTDAGMRYVHIPVDFDAPTEQDYAAFLAALASCKGDRVHVHCIVNARVTAFFYRYDREVRGLDKAIARARMETVWRPGGVWATFIGDAARVDMPHEFAGRDYRVAIDG